MAERYTVAVATGSLREDDGVTLPHEWTEEGVSVRGRLTGAHVLHLAVATCVLNDLYREARDRGVPLAGVHVSAEGGFDIVTGASTGVEYSVALDSSLLPEQVQELLLQVDEVAEVPKALRAGIDVRRVGHA
ncbi:OsmC-like protein [Nocardioides scoriae]|uniref:OsmC-like protein n=1 Tax=Nocardioides scoriae TaxID=642780 RepID=A0A1H1XSY2_9ACTN|nr:OsmC family protein [Nocardioides scoriae]SDT12320.1 OsmC-like protein [Nocardioides scoriae]